MNQLTRATLLSLTLMGTATSLTAQSFRLDFQEGAAAWQTVLDGVMGGRSSGRVALAEMGVLAFTGKLSLENNGGFSQMRTAVDGTTTAGAEGFEIECRGDGRTYKFDIRLSNVRMMAGAYQQDFATVAGEWTKIRLPLDAFKLYSFGRQLRNAPELDAGKIESIGITLADKQPGDFRLELRSVAAYSGNTAAAANGSALSTRKTDLVSVAKAAGLDTLLELVAAAKLELPQEPVTIFAPTDAAFAALPAATVKALLQPEGRNTLRQILSFHIAPDARSSADVLNMRSLPSLAGQPLSVDYERRSIAGAGLVAVDVRFDGGIVHVIDRVMMPETRSIAQLGAATEQLSTLVTAVTAAGLGSQLSSGNGPWTVFAPVDSAFAKLPKGAVASLLEAKNRPRLTDILGLHVVPGRIAARDLLAKKRLTGLLGKPVEITLRDGKLVLNGSAKVITADIQASNGVVHLIDAVLLPAVDQTAEPVAVATRQIEHPNDDLGTDDLSRTVEALYALAVDRGAKLFNAGNPEACAAVYEVLTESILRLAGDRLTATVRDRLVRASRDAEAASGWTDRAWAFRRALDAAYAELRTTTRVQLRPRSSSAQG